VIVMVLELTGCRRHGGAQQLAPQQVPPQPQEWLPHTVGAQAHSPLLQLVAQTCPHEPQLFRSVEVSVQTPPQSSKPGAHVHTPPLHVSPAPHTAQPEPQWLESSFVS
jgi:hypothetical protein